MVRDLASTGCKVHFEPGNVDVVVEQGSNLLQAAIQAGINVIATCGGTGTCGTCKVLVEEGETNLTRTPKLDDDEFSHGVRQACQSTVMSNLRVYVPVESRLETAIPIDRQKPRKGTADGVLARGWRFSPPVTKYFVKLPTPTLADNVSDLSRLLRSLKQEHNLSNVTVSYEIVKNLPIVLRSNAWQATVTTLVTAAEEETVPARRSSRVVNIEAGNTSNKHYSLAIDIGTTTVKGQLLDLRHGVIIAEDGQYNGQIAYGTDVITRIAYSQNTGGLDRLQRLVVETINTILGRLLNSSGIDRTSIGHISAAGNTTMIEILLGIDPKYIRLSPYTPVATYLPPVKAASIGIEVGSYVYLSALPLVASYIGGDITAGVVAAGMHQTKKLTLYMDLGTNGQIVIGNSEFMVTAACSAGPAFEGGEIKHGTIATAGAIEECYINRSNFEPTIDTIGGVKPKGICGSGLISTAASLVESGIISQNGHFNTLLSSNRIRRGEDGYEYVLTWGQDTQTGKDIVITETDIGNLMRAKAAMYAGFQTLLKSVGFEPRDIRQVIITGAFGSNINIDRAMTIGLLPDLPRRRFVFIGNGSLTGARLADFSIDIVDEVKKVAKLMTNLELSENPDFMNDYVAALFLPHTNMKEFPTVARRLAHLAASTR